jgi:tetratricopeptide (TPR) repeat protein
VLEEEMQVEMIISNRLEGRARSARGAAFRFSLSMTLMLVFCVSAAQAQNDSTSKPPASEETSAATSSTVQTRARRVAEMPDATSNDKATTNDAAESETGNSVDDPPLAIGNGSDRLSTLRLQIESAKTDNERGRLRRMLIDYLVALGKKSEAVAELRVMSREDRLDPIGFYNIGNALARLGDTDTAIDAYRKAIKQRHGNYARAFNNLGVMFLRQGRWDEAQEAIATALRLENFRYSEASYNLGRVYAARGEADLAIREWSRALAVEPDHADAAIALARAYAEDGSPERGLAVIDTFIERRGPSAEMTDARREILFGGDAREENRTEVAPTANVMRPAKATNANSPAPAPRDASRLTTASGSNTNARNSTKGKSVGGKRASAALRPLTVDRESYELLQRARASREDGRNEEAAKIYRRVLSRNNGFFPPANLELGYVLSELERNEEAVETLATVAKREGARYPVAYYHLGRQYEKLGRFNLAAEAFEKAAAAYGDTNPQFLLDLSRVREKEGNAHAALAAMEAYVRISQSLGRVLDWSDERLAQLRQKVTATSQQPK